MCWIIRENSDDIQEVGTMKYVSYRIRKLRQEEIKILDDFLYEAIFIPEGTKAPPKEIIKEPELQVCCGFWEKER